MSTKVEPRHRRAALQAILGWDSVVTDELDWVYKGTSGTSTFDFALAYRVANALFDFEKMGKESALLETQQEDSPLTSSQGIRKLALGVHCPDDPDACCALAAIKDTHEIQYCRNPDGQVEIGLVPKVAK